MEKEFVPYELAVKLKELGFDQLCLCHYHYGNILRSKIVSYVEGDCLKLDKFDKSTPAPLWQQAFGWFRDYYNAVCCFNWHTKGCLIDDEFVFKEEKTTRKELINWAYEIDYYGSNFERELTDESDAGGFGFETYEKARLACLEKLIELVS